MAESVVVAAVGLVGMGSTVGVGAYSDRPAAHMRTKGEDGFLTHVFRRLAVDHQGWLLGVDAPLCGLGARARCRRHVTFGNTQPMYFANDGVTRDRTQLLRYLTC